MNLISDPWIPVFRADGSKGHIAPWQIAETDNPAVEIAAPRADFQGALYQFLIGLLQSTFAPQEEDDWLDQLEEPNAQLLKVAFNKVAFAFELDLANGPAFMQEIDDFDGDTQLIEDLIGGELSSKTRSDNSDLFVKSATIQVISPYWAAMALFNLQTSGVLAWGQHRIGLRGNGPVTSLVFPIGKSNLWEKLWLNVLSREHGALIPGDWSRKSPEDIFPWLTKTKVSPNKERTTPLDCNPLQHYWPLPRRVRLLIEPVAGVCDLSGEKITHGVKTYKRIKDGVFYSDGWVHPLSPYQLAKKKQQFPASVVGKDMSYGYGDWAALVCGVEDDKTSTAISTVAKVAFSAAEPEGISIRCFGYRADTAKVTGYIDKTLPAFKMGDQERAVLSAWVCKLINLADKVIEKLYLAISEAWWGTTKAEKERNKQAISAFKSNKSVEQRIWQATEADFYRHIPTLAAAATSGIFPPTVAKAWLLLLKKVFLEVFDDTVLSGDMETINIRRIVSVRKALEKQFSQWPCVKELNTDN